MASYKAVTPFEIMRIGGKADGETTSQLKRCAIYDGNIAAWLAAHGCEYNNTTGLVYTNGRVLALDDIKLTASQQQENLTYEFSNWIEPQTLFVRATSRPICDEMSQRIDYINHGDANWGSVQPKIVGGDSTNDPIVMAGSTYYSPGEYTIEDSYGNSVTVFINGHVEEHTSFIYPQGVVPYGPNGGLVNEESCFSLGTRIILDFQGENVRGKYFSFIVGGNELDVVNYAKYGQVSDHSGLALGWAGGIYIGYGSGGSMCNDQFMNNARYMRRLVPVGSEEWLVIPPYKSVAQVWLSNLGFAVLFNDTNDINDGWVGDDGEYWRGREVMVAGYHLHTNIPNNISDGVWATSGEYGGCSRIIECRNFRME